MATWIAWTEAVPWTAKAAILEWQSLMDSVIQTLDNMQITVWYEPLASLSLRRLSNFLECFNLVVLNEQDIERVKATIDSVVNQSKLPRQYFVRVSTLKDASDESAYPSRSEILLRSSSTEPIRSIAEIISQL